MYNTYSCKSKDFAFHYAGYYAEGGNGAIVNVQVNNGTTTYQIHDDTTKKTQQLKKAILHTEKKK